MNRLSVCIIAQNEQQNLPRVLRSAQAVADEIIVVDGGSTDRTQEIAREAGAKVFFRPYTDQSDQKNYAVSLASSDWVFVLDADEELSEELTRSVCEWKRQEPQYFAYEMPRLTQYLGAWIRHSRWYPDWQRRIFRRDKASHSGRMHSGLRFEGRAGRLRGDLLHYTVSDLAHHKAKLERFADGLGHEMFDQGKRDWRAAMWLATPWSWFRHYILGVGFLDGSQGLVISRMAARCVWLKFRKLGELVEAERREKNRGAV